MTISKTLLSSLSQIGDELLQQNDPVLHNLLLQEYHRQMNSLYMVAASSIADPSVLAGGMIATNVTTEGYPGNRYHAGCKYVDEIENLAIDRAKAVFKAQYANLQPHSGSSANQIVLFSLLKPGDTILGMELNSGGHLTHGAKASVTGQYFCPISYTVNNDGWLDYEEILHLARQYQPKLIICGASSYTRTIHYQKFREIADEVGAYLLADISHVAGLVVADAHPSPIDHAHFTTTSTYKQLFGPRGGLILIGKDYEKLGPDNKKTLAETIQKAVFPFFQGTPNLSAIAGKATMLQRLSTQEFKTLAHRITTNAQALASNLKKMNYKVITGGTDTHMVLVDVHASGVTGLGAELALEACNIIVNKNKIPGDQANARVTSGIRLGTNVLALRGMGAKEMSQCAELIHQVISSLKKTDKENYVLDQQIQESVCTQVQQLCNSFPVPNYPF